MIWNDHSKFAGKHALLSPSSYHWLNYDKEDGKEQLYSRYLSSYAQDVGTLVHEFACKRIAEVVLYYSDNCFGTTDAISFDKNSLRIHDLKTGKGAVHIEQLEIYAALFCLEYNKKPGDLYMELRIYQPGNLLTMKPEVDDIVPIMDKIVSSDKFLKKIESEGLVP